MRPLIAFSRGNRSKIHNCVLRSIIRHQTEMFFGQIPLCLRFLFWSMSFLVLTRTNLLLTGLFNHTTNMVGSQVRDNNVGFCWGTTNTFTHHNGLSKVDDDAKDAPTTEIWQPLNTECKKRVQSTSISLRVQVHVYLLVVFWVLWPKQQISWKQPNQFNLHAHKSLVYSVSLNAPPRYKAKTYSLVTVMDCLQHKQASHHHSRATETNLLYLLKI